jgi:hypothetical protein
MFYVTEWKNIMTTQCLLGALVETAVGTLLP